MKVILTETVKKLGSVGDMVNVSAGFARNFIIPNKYGILADEGNEKNITDKKKMLEKKVIEEKARAEEVKKSVEGLSLNITKKVGGNGRLFGTVTNNEIAKALEAAGYAIEKRMIVVDTPIKTLGNFEVKAKIFQGVEATFKVNIEIDPKQAEELAKRAKMKKAAPVAVVTEENAENTEDAENTEADTEENNEA